MLIFVLKDWITIKTIVVKKSKYIYLMKRGDEEMYNGFIKYNIEKDIVDAVVEYKEGKLGGEVLFVSKQNLKNEDDGYLIDIIYDS